MFPTDVGHFRSTGPNVMQALLVTAFLLFGLIGMQAIHHPTMAAAQTEESQTVNPVCGSLPVISEACDQLVEAATWALDTPGGLAESVVAGAFDYFARWVAVGAIGAIDLVWVGINGTTTPVIDSSASVFQTSMAGARALAFPLLVLAALYSMLKRDAQMAVKAAFLYLPGSVLAMVVSGYVITALLAATDQLSDAYLTDGETGIAVWLDELGGLIAAGLGITAPILLVVFSFVLISASVLVWLVMIVRSAAILITYAFMPLAFAAIIFPATRSWIKRLIEIQLSFILAKPVIVAVMSLGSQTLNDADNALVAMMQASALFYLAAFSPFALMKLLPFVGDEAVAAMEQPSKAPSRIGATAVGVVSGQRIASFLAGSQQEGPAAAVASAAGSVPSGGMVGDGGPPIAGGGAGGGTGGSSPPDGGTQPPPSSPTSPPSGRPPQDFS